MCLLSINPSLCSSTKALFLLLLIEFYLFWGRGCVLIMFQMEHICFVEMDGLITWCIKWQIWNQLFSTWGLARVLGFQLSQFSSTEPCYLEICPFSISLFNSLGKFRLGRQKTNKPPLRNHLHNGRGTAASHSNSGHLYYI